MKFTLATIATGLLLAVQCRRQVEISPDLLYYSIEQRFVSGDLAGAETEAARFKHLVESSNPFWRSKFRLQQAQVRIYQGRPDAFALLILPLSATSSEPALEIERISLLAIAYERAGDLARANEILSQVEQQCSVEISCADVRLAEGILATEQGRFIEAQHAFELSLAGARRSGDSFRQTQALSNLGVVAERQEHYDDALDRFRQSSAVARTIGARLLLEKSMGNVGWALYKLGDDMRALENSKAAEEEAAAIKSYIDQVRWLNNAGLSQFRLGDLGAAKSSYEQSYKLARSLKNDEQIANALLALAYLSLETGDLEDALQKSREVQRIAAQMGNLDDALGPSLLEAIALSRQGQSSAAKIKLLTLERTTTAGESVRWETEDALAKLSADVGDAASADTWFQRAIATFRLQRASLRNIESRLPFYENGSSLYLDYMEQLIREGKTDAALRVLDQSRAETLAEGLGVARDAQGRHTVQDPQAIARQLGGTILVYCLRPGTSYLWAVGPARTGFFRLPGKETILPLVAAHTQSILSSKDVLAQQNTPGEELYRQLVEPAHALLAPNAHVFLIADESLSGLNFETLPTTDIEPHYWIEDADIINARSISLLAARQGRRTPVHSAEKLLLVGDPIYTRPEDARLAHAAEEVTRVSQHFEPGNRLLLTGARATPAAYQQSHPETYTYIHFVAHASASELNPLDSSVILSATPGSDEAYKLYARSVLDQRLSANLVTISACYGSGVRSYSGEGLVGLAWAFLHTGSHNVIGALWEVSDASTPQLMGDLYDGLSKGDRPDVALRSAKLAMIHGGGVFRKPFYWAAFQLYSGA